MGVFLEGRDPRAVFRAVVARAGFVVTAAGVSSLPACTLDQVQLGQWYRIVTPASGACPSLEWHFVIDAKRRIGGSLSEAQGPRIADLSGTLAAGDQFHMTAAALHGGPLADVTGRFSSIWTTFAIAGDGAGPACNGKTFRLHLGRYFQSQSGGGGGGQ